MLEIMGLFLALTFVVGGGHIALLNGLFWLLDAKDSVEHKRWSMDTMMVIILVPLSLAVASIEIYLLYGKG